MHVARAGARARPPCMLHVVYVVAGSVRRACSATPPDDDERRQDARPRAHRLWGRELHEPAAETGDVRAASPRCGGVPPREISSCTGADVAPAKLEPLCERPVCLRLLGRVRKGSVHHALLHRRCERPAAGARELVWLQGCQGCGRDPSHTRSGDRMGVRLRKSQARPARTPWLGAEFRQTGPPPLQSLSLRFLRVVVLRQRCDTASCCTGRSSLVLVGTLSWSRCAPGMAASRCRRSTSSSQRWRS